MARTTRYGDRLDQYAPRGVRPSAGSRLNDRPDYPEIVEGMTRSALVTWRTARAAHGYELAALWADTNTDDEETG